MKYSTHLKRMEENPVTFKELRQLTGMTQKEFGEAFGIGYETVRSWDRSPDTVNYRKPPEWVINLLAYAVYTNFGSTKSVDDNA